MVPPGDDLVHTDLLVLGEKDALTGDPEGVEELARNVADNQIEVLDTGHLMGVEQADTVNTLIVEFFERE